MNEIPKLVDVAKPVSRGQCIAICSYMREIKAEKQWSNICLKKLEKEEQIKSQSIRREKIIKETAEIHKYKINV